ncbi:MAG: hypothetical protein HKN87_12460 [Saprospiraceae bacterium]|nr:hypothetical protein [Saprospiraceae bacterium]
MFSGQVESEPTFHQVLEKSLNIYRRRRNLFCDLLEQRLGWVLSFRRPEGGLAVWAKFNARIPLDDLRKRLLRKGVLIPRAMYSEPDGRPINGIRMGFASLDDSDMEKAIAIIDSEVENYS